MMGEVSEKPDMGRRCGMLGMLKLLRRVRAVLFSVFLFCFAEDICVFTSLLFSCPVLGSFP